MIYLIVLRKGGNFLTVNGSIRFYLSKSQAIKILNNDPDKEIIEIKLTDLQKFIGK